MNLFMRFCVFTAWFTVTGFHFSIWANLYMNIGYVDLTSLAARRSIAMPSSCLFLHGICVEFEWLHLPTVGVRDVFAGALGLLLKILCRRRKAEGSCQSSRRMCGSFLRLGAGQEYAIHLQTKARPSKFSAYLLDLADTSLLQVPILKMMCIWPLWSHFLLCLFSVI